MHCSRCSEPFDCAKVYVWAEFHNDVNFGLATLCEACWKDVQMGLRALLTSHVWGRGVIPRRLRSPLPPARAPLPPCPRLVTPASLVRAGTPVLPCRRTSGGADVPFFGMSALL